MIYYYTVVIEFCKGSLRFLKVYNVDFLSIIKLFNHLENKHKGNYTIMSIRGKKGGITYDRNL